MKYSCPSCKADLEIQRAFNGKATVCCPSCGIEAVTEHVKNPDEVYLDFLTMYDDGRVLPGRGGDDSAPGGGSILQDEGLVRDKAEIDKMIGGNSPDELTRSVLYSRRDYISHYEVIKDPDPEFGSPVGAIVKDRRLENLLREGGIGRFYRFQEEAIVAILGGQNIVIEAPTASGKTEAFAVPAIQGAQLEGSPGNIFAIFVYPTKTLARDQYYKIARLAAAVGVGARVFDGDTGSNERKAILDDPPHIIVTNFDVLHYHMWNRTRFASVLDTAKLVVVDEVHTYSGIFGSNVHYIIKRLKRMCGRLRFVAASATLKDAEQFCAQLFGEEMRLIRGSGRRGQTDFVMAFPSMRTQRALMVDLTHLLTRRGHKTMVFNNSHMGAELVAIHAKRQGINIAVHRAGINADRRGYVERKFKADRLQAISCTPTLELGIDVGNVDGVISSMIPVNRLFQRIGRAARKGQNGYAFLALGNDPISQYYRNHPRDYLEDAEGTYIDPRNPFVEEFQVLAMACDRPLSGDDLADHRKAVEKHVRDGNLAEVGGKYVPAPGIARSLLSEYSIRGIGGSIDIVLNSKKIGDRVLPIALEELHKDAVYFLGGVRYRVAELLYPQRSRAVLERIPTDYPYYTRALTEEWPCVEGTYESRTAFGLEVAFCKLRISKRVYGYVNVELGQDAMQGERVDLDVPLQYDFVTKGLVFHAPKPEEAIYSAEDEDYVEASGYHAAEHAIIEGSNMVTGGASRDMGGISMGASGLIFVYDGAIGGSGASKALYDRFERAVGRSLSIVAECPCRGESGCPRCTFSYRCGNNNEFLHKRAAAEVFRRIIGGQRTAIDDAPEGDRPFV